MISKISKIKTVASLVVLTLLFQACEPGDLPNADNTKNDRERWSYDFSTVMSASLYNQVPAIDEAGNIYLIADVQSGGDIIKLSADGAEQWVKSESNYPMSRIIYLDNKVYYINNQTLICRDAANGENIWNTEVSGAQSIFAINNNKIFVTRFVDDGFLGSNHLAAYNMNGSLVWETKIKYSDVDTISYANAISVNGNNIYVGVLAEVGSSEFAIINYVDDGDHVSKNWTWLAPGDFSVGGGSPRIKDFAIDDNGNLIFGMENSGTEYVFSVSPAGTDNWSTVSNLSKIISNVSVDGEGNCYVAYDRCEKIDKNGIAWTSSPNVNWDYRSLFSKSPAIDNNGNLYYADLSTMLTAVSPHGDSLWSQYYGCNLCNNEFHNVTINRNGDIIVISKAGVTAFKGEGVGLAEKGWPKVFGNYGNTAGKETNH
jgi:outer membrane protein assembly factor BamB